MKRLALVLALLIGQAHAGCIVGQKISPNKLGHLAGTALAVYVAVDRTNDLWAGAAVGLSAGLVRELYKASTPGMSCEWASMAYDAAGLGLGLYLGKKFSLSPKPGGAQVNYATTF